MLYQRMVRSHTHPKFYLLELAPRSTIIASNPPFSLVSDMCIFFLERNSTFDILCHGWKMLYTESRKDPVQINFPRQMRVSCIVSESSLSATGHGYERPQFRSSSAHRSPQRSEWLHCRSLITDHFPSEFFSSDKVCDQR